MDIVLREKPWPHDNRMPGSFRFLDDPVTLIKVWWDYLIHIMSGMWGFAFPQDQNL